MAKYIPENIPNSNVVPKANAVVEIDEIEVRDSGKGKLMHVVGLRVLEPKAIKGRMVREFCTLGSDDDPQAEDPLTLEASMGMVSYKQFLVKAGVKPSGDTEVDNEKAQGKTLGVTIDIQPDDKGVDRNRIVDKWKVGEREPELLTDTDKKPAAKKADAKPAKKKAVAEPELEDEEDDDEEEAEDEEEEEKPVKKKTTTAKAEAEPKKKKAAKPETKECPSCGESFPRAEIMDHIETCTEDDDD